MSEHALKYENNFFFSRKIVLKNYLLILNDILLLFWL